MNRYVIFLHRSRLCGPPPIRCGRIRQQCYIAWSRFMVVGGMILPRALRQCSSDEHDLAIRQPRSAQYITWNRRAGRCRSDVTEWSFQLCTISPWQVVQELLFSRTVVGMSFRKTEDTTDSAKTSYQHSFVKVVVIQESNIWGHNQSMGKLAFHLPNWFHPLKPSAWHFPNFDHHVQRRSAALVWRLLGCNLKFTEHVTTSVFVVRHKEIEFCIPTFHEREKWHCLPPLYQINNQSRYKFSRSWSHCEFQTAEQSRCSSIRDWIVFHRLMIASQMILYCTVAKPLQYQDSLRSFAPTSSSCWSGQSQGVSFVGIGYMQKARRHQFKILDDETICISSSERGGEKHRLNVPMGHQREGHVLSFDSDWCWK